MLYYDGYVVLGLNLYSDRTTDTRI